MSLAKIAFAVVWFVAGYYSLGTFVHSNVGYYNLAIALTFGFLILEQRV